MGKGRDKVIKDILVESLSKDHVRVIQALEKPRYDEDVAEDLKIKATVVRTILNDLHSASLVEYDRSKNKKTGWYTYMWNRRDDKLDEYIGSYLQEKLVKLTSELEGEKTGIKFACKCSVIPFENAVDAEFMCQECGDQLVEHDNSNAIDSIVSEIAKVESLLAKT
ncbi:MAG: hypothetical protein ABH834_06295 [Candidatus Altiarchaeota archaeon]